jgi:hypothetical protein
MEKKKSWNFWGKFLFLRYDVLITSVFVHRESTHQGFHMRYDTIWYRMVLSISKFDLGVSNFRPAARTMKAKADQPPKINQLSGGPYATFTPSLELI